MSSRINSRITPHATVVASIHPASMRTHVLLVLLLYASFSHAWKYSDVIAVGVDDTGGTPVPRAVAVSSLGRLEVDIPDGLEVNIGAINSSTHSITIHGESGELPQDAAAQSALKVTSPARYNLELVAADENTMSLLPAAGHASCAGATHVTIMGTVDTDGILEIHASFDNSNYYKTPHSVHSENGTVYIFFQSSALYYKVKSSVDLGGAGTTIRLTCV
jgi:hypothetical protein